MALLFTIAGFLLVKFIAYIFLSVSTVSREIGELLSYTPSGMKRVLPKGIYFIVSILGILLLAKAYYYGISGEAWNSAINMGITVLLGTTGTICIFFGMRLFIGLFAELGNKRKLNTYNFRQVQELVIHRSTMLAVCSLLIFSALCLFAAGVAILLW